MAVPQMIDSAVLYLVYTIQEVRSGIRIGICTEDFTTAGCSEPTLSNKQFEK